MNFDMKERVFVYDESKWKKLLNRNYLLDEPLKVMEVKNGLVLPLRKRTDLVTRNGAFEGGVCEEDGQFVAGICRKLSDTNSNMSCSRGYKPSADIQIRHETVIFGGVLHGAFSHAITENLSRLWYLADHPDATYKYVFLESPVTGEYRLLSILEAAGLTSDRMEIIKRPTKFDRIIVPEESYHMLSNYKPGVNKIYDYMRSRVNPGPYKKVYLSRTALNAHEVTFNEEYFEEFYRKREFEIVHPEQLLFSEQLSIMSGADEIVASEGGLVLLTQFCRPEAKKIILLRTAHPHVSTPLCVRSILNNSWLIDAHFNFLPATLEGDRSIYFLGPTRCWIDYLKHERIPHTSEEVSMDIHVKPMIYDYVCLWGKIAAEPKAYKNYKNNVIVTNQGPTHLKPPVPLSISPFSPSGAV